MRKFARHLLVLAAVAILALAASGCVLIEAQTSAQQSPLSGVQITTTACASDIGSNNNYSPPDPNCQGAGKGGNAGGDAADLSVQLLLGYRIPSAASSPDTITTTSPSGGAGFTFAKDASYTANLQSLSPAPSGQQWVGYMSTVQAYTQAGTQRFTVAPTFELQQGSDGSAFQGPFNYRTVVGFRSVDGSHLASRPVTCGATLTDAYNTDGLGDCADSPSPATIATNLQQPTEDLGLLDAPGTESVNQGDVARIKFQADYAGDGNPAPTFDLSASTDIPGAVAVPSAPELAPADGVNPLRVILRVPVDTPPGHYDVTLTAALAGGETRSSTHDVLVTPTTVRCDAIAPTISGTGGADVLVGTPGPDVIAGYGGNDVISGLGGNDVICAGSGNDTVRGGPGNDVISGRRGNDLLSGGPGHNRILPGPGKDRIIQ